MSTTKYQDWFDEADKEIHELLEKKRSFHNHLLAKPDYQAAKAAYKTACSTLQAKLRTMQNDWWTGLAKRTQQYADMGDMRAFYEALKAVYGSSHQIQAPLRSLDGSTVLTDMEAILQRWSEHFESLFSEEFSGKSSGEWTSRQKKRQNRKSNRTRQKNMSGTHARNPVWVQVQQRDRRHDLCAETDTGEMHRAEHWSKCSFHRPDQGL